VFKAAVRFKATEKTMTATCQLLLTQVLSTTSISLAQSSTFLIPQHSEPSVLEAV